MKLLLIVLWLICATLAYAIPLPEEFFKPLDECKAKAKAIAWWGEGATAEFDYQTGTYWLGNRMDAVAGSRLPYTAWYGFSKKNWEDAFDDAVKYKFGPGYKDGDRQGACRPTLHTMRESAWRRAAHAETIPSGDVINPLGIAPPNPIGLKPVPPPAVRLPGSKGEIK